MRARLTVVLSLVALLAFGATYALGRSMRSEPPKREPAPLARARTAGPVKVTNLGAAVALPALRRPPQRSRPKGGGSPTPTPTPTPGGGGTTPPGGGGTTPPGGGGGGGGGDEPVGGGGGGGGGG